MRPITCLLVTAFFLSFWQGNSQTFSVSLGSSVDVEAAEAITIFDGDIIIGGTKNDSAFVMRYNPTTGPVWVKTFKTLPSYPATYVNSLETTSDNFIIGTAFSFGSSMASSYYFKIDGSGNFIFLKHNNDNYYFKRMLEKNASEYVVFGAKYTLGSEYTDLKVFSVDKNTANITTVSSKINLTSPGFASSTDDMEAATVVGDYLYSSGRFWHSGSALGQMRPHLIKYNSQGHVVWSKYLHKNYLLTSRIYPQNIIHKSPNYFFIPYFTDDNCTGTCTNFVPGLMKTDTSGNVIFDKTYNINLSDGELLRGMVTDGIYYYLVGYTNYNGGQRDFFILKVDADGDLIKSKRYGSPVYNEFFITSFVQPAVYGNGYIYIAGSVGNDVTLMKIDTTLNLICDDVDITCSFQSFTPFSDDLDIAYISDTLIVNDAVSSSGYFPLVTTCDSLGTVDTFYSTTSVMLDATFSGADGYFWNTGSTDPVIVVSQSGVYTCIVNDACCSFQNMYVVCIRPANGILMDSTITCETRQYTFLPVASQNNDFAWYVDGALFSTSTTISPPLDSGLHTISLLVTNTVCYDSVWTNLQTFLVNKPTFEGAEFIIPNIFTPNGDGINDVLRSQIFPCENYDIKIYDRWGMQMYASTDVNAYWDGKFNGNAAADGQYVFVIHYNRACEANNAVQLVKGWVTLKR